MILPKNIKMKHAQINVFYYVIFAKINVRNEKTI